MKYLRALILCSLAFAACEAEKNDPFRIAEGRVGPLLREHPWSVLDSIYAGDSLVRDTSRLAIGQNRKVEIYARGGKHLLTLSPDSDSLLRVGNIRIHDSRYQTDLGINLGSTFGEIQAKYPIRKLITSLNNVIVLLKDSEVYFTISREDLPGSLRFSKGSIEAVQIPDKTPVKYMMVGWD